MTNRDILVYTDISFKQPSRQMRQEVPTSFHFLLLDTSRVLPISKNKLQPAF